MRIDEIDDPDASLHVMGQFRGLFRQPSNNAVTGATGGVGNDPRKICFVSNTDSFNHNLEIGDALKLPSLTAANSDYETFTVSSVVNATCVCVDKSPTHDFTDEEIFKDGNIFRIQTGDNCDLATVDSSGNFGINTNSPEYKLDVFGTSRFKGYANQQISSAGIANPLLVGNHSPVSPSIAYSLICKYKFFLNSLTVTLTAFPLFL